MYIPLCWSGHFPVGSVYSLCLMCTAKHPTDCELNVLMMVTLVLWLHRRTEDLPAESSVNVLQPLPQPPLRHSKSLQIAPEAQPAALLLVDVLTASNVASVEAPKAGQQQTADIQEMQQVICALAFEDTLNKTHTGNCKGHLHDKSCNAFQ